MVEINSIHGYKLCDETAREKIEALEKIADAMVFKGAIGKDEISEKIFTPNEWQAGWVWRFREAMSSDTLAGLAIEGFSGQWFVEAGDMLMALLNHPEEAILPQNAKTEDGDYYFTIIQTNIDGAVTGPASAVTSGNLPVFDGETGRVIKDSGLSVSDVMLDVVSDDGDTALDVKKLTFDSEDVIHTSLSDLGSDDGNAHINIKTTYTNSTPMVTALGGLAAGTTFENMSLKDILDKLLYPYTKPTVTLTATANGAGIYEKGTSVSPTFKVVTTKKSNNITSLGLYSGAILLASNVIVQAAGGTQTGITLTNALTATTTVTAKVGDGTSTVTSSGITYTFVDPYYYGVVSAVPTTSAEVTALTKLIQAKGTKTVTHTTTSEKGRYCFAYPASYGDIAKVLDENGFDNTEDFTKSVISVTTAAGTAVDYNVYTYNNPVTAGSMSMTYSY